MNYNKNDFDFCRSYMVADERIIWKGKPDTKIRFSSDLHTLVFGIFWLGFSLFWCSGVYARGGGMMAFLVFHSWLSVFILLWESQFIPQLNARIPHTL